MDLNGGSYSRLNWWWYARPSPLFCVILRTLVKKSEENHGESSWYILGYLYPITLLDVKFDILILISNYPNYPNCWISRWLQHVVSGHSSHETLIWVMRIFVPLLSRFHDSYEKLVLLALALALAIRFIRKAFKSRIFFIFFPWNGPMLWGIFIIFY